MAKAKGEAIEDGLKVMVVGMPNVGKSSLLNALRRVGVHKGQSPPYHLSIAFQRKNLKDYVA